ncbi:hypothetical protein EBR43_02315 [bacterium]|nr:hypothetical protein [bacterium]
MSFFPFFAGIPIICSFLLLWFVSPLKLSLGKLFFRQNFIAPDQFDDYLFAKSHILGKLLSCWVCLSFWSSLAYGIGCTLLLQQPIWFGLLTFSTYPSLCYLFKVAIKH